MKKTLGLVSAVLAVCAAVPAIASVTRTAEGNYTWSGVVITDPSTGRILGTEAQTYTKFVDTVGVYGGGDTASGRRTAKVRAIKKAFDCSWYFFTYGRTSQTFVDRCITNATIVPRLTSAQQFSEVITMDRCPRARELARQAGVSGPVTVGASVGFFGDAAGTEEDYQGDLGSFNYHHCY